MPQTFSAANPSRPGFAKGVAPFRDLASTAAVALHARADSALNTLKQEFMGARKVQTNSWKKNLSEAIKFEEHTSVSGCS